MRLNIDVISGYNDTSVNVSPSLYALEHRNGNFWRPLIGRDLNVTFYVRTEQAGRAQMIWSWFDNVGAYPVVKLDSKLWTTEYGGFVNLGAGVHQLNMHFPQVRQPIPGGDPRAIAAAITRLEIVSAPLPITSSGEWVMVSTLLFIFFLGGWWLLFRRFSDATLV